MVLVPITLNEIVINIWVPIFVGKLNRKGHGVGLAGLTNYEGLKTIKISRLKKQSVMLCLTSFNPSNILGGGGGPNCTFHQTV